MAAARRKTRNEIRRALYEWIVWAPLLVPFVFLAMDTSLSLKARSAEREFGSLDAKRRQTTVELNEARAREAQWRDIKWVYGIIDQLKMLPPDPQQIQVVVAHPDTPMPVMKEGPREGMLDMADSSAAAADGGAPRAVPTAPAVALSVMASAPAEPANVDSRPVAAPVTPAPALLVPVDPPMAVSAPAVATAKVLELPKEKIEDLDSPDTPTNDLLANL